jgi:hypothetical protein
MTTPYSVSTSIGSVSYDNYVNAPITGPLSTNQYPSVIPYHSYGTLTGIRPTPPQFLPMQEPIYAEMNTNARNLYRRVFSKSQDLENANIRKGLDKYVQQGTFYAAPQQNGMLNPSPPMKKHIYSSGRHLPVSTHTNYIQPIPSSMYLNIKKSVAIGKSGYKVGLPVEAPISTKSYYPSGVRSAIRKARSGGCTAPKKKGSIYNYSLTNGAVCAWGSLPRQNY